MDKILVKQTPRGKEKTMEEKRKQEIVDDYARRQDEKFRKEYEEKALADFYSRNDGDPNAYLENPGNRDDLRLYTPEEFHRIFMTDYKEDGSVYDEEKEFKKYLYEKVVTDSGIGKKRWATCAFAGYVSMNQDLPVSEYAEMLKNAYPKFLEAISKGVYDEPEEETINAINDIVDNGYDYKNGVLTLKYKNGDTKAILLDTSYQDKDEAVGGTSITEERLKQSVKEFIACDLGNKVYHKEYYVKAGRGDYFGDYLMTITRADPELLLGRR